MMENLNDIIASLTPDDIQSLKETAQAIFGNDFNSEKNADNSQKETNPFFSSNSFSSFNPDMISNIGKIMSLMNSDSGKRCRLIEALKPNLSRERQKKADEAMQILKLLEIMPMIAGLKDKF